MDAPDFCGAIYAFIVDELATAWVSRDEVREQVDKWLMEKPKTTGDVQESPMGHENNVADPAFEAEQQQKMMSLFE